MTESPYVRESGAGGSRLRRIVEADHKKWGELIRAIGLKAE